MATLTAEKAKKILKDGSVNGKALNAAQKRYFGFIAGGGVPSKELGGDLQELGLGDWIKDNTQGIIGGLKTAAGIALTATGVGAGIGASLIGSGVGDIGQEIIGDRKTAALDENQATADQNATRSMYNQNKTQQLFNTANANSNFQTMKYGGLIKYEGQSHGGPNEGVPVDAQGNPVVVSKSKPVASVEGGERVWHSPQGPYVFPKTFQNEMEKLEKQHKMRLGGDLSNPDPISQESLKNSLSKLLEKNEAIKAKKAARKQTKLMKTGGKLPQLEEGELLDNIHNPPRQEQLFDTNTEYSMGPEPWSPFKGQAIGSGINAGLGAISNIAMGIALPKPEKIRASLITAPKVSYAEQRQQADVDATEARSRFRGRSREAGLGKTASQALFNAADVGITGKTGAIKAQSTMTERNLNAQNQFQASARNQMTQSRADQINALRKDQYIKDKFGLFSQGLQNLTGGASDIMKAYQDSQFLNMVGARSGYELLKKKGSPAYLSPLKNFYKDRV